MIVQASWEATRGSNNQARPRHGRRYYHHGHPVPTPQRARDGKNGLRQHAKKQACTNDHQKSNLKMASSDSDHVKVVQQIFFLARDHFASLTTNRMGIGALLTIIILDSAYPSSPSFKHPLTTRIANLQILVSACHPHHRSSSHLQLQLQICKS